MQEKSEAFEFDQESFDSRDVQDRLEWIEDTYKIEEETGEFTLSIPEEIETEYRDLVSFQYEGLMHPDWEDGVTFVREDKFPDYCEESAYANGYISQVPEFITSNIDWDGVADSLKMEYGSFELRGESYLARD